jgi:hypothetical protein
MLSCLQALQSLDSSIPLAFHFHFHLDLLKQTSQTYPVFSNTIFHLL